MVFPELPTIKRQVQDWGRHRRHDRFEERQLAQRKNRETKARPVIEWMQEQRTHLQRLLREESCCELVRDEGREFSVQQCMRAHTQCIALIAYFSALMGQHEEYIECGCITYTEKEIAEQVCQDPVAGAGLGGKVQALRT